MGNKWTECELGDFIELKRGYDLPKSARNEGSIPIISSSGFTDYNYKAMVKGPGVVTGRYGTIGEVFYSEEDFWPLNTTLYVVDFKGNDPLFVYYLLQTISYADYTDKAAVPGVNRNHLHKAKVKVPISLDIQQKVAAQLYLLEKRVMLGKQINQTLEQMSQTLFKSWFVDFDPVIDNALDAGKSIPEALQSRAELRQKVRNSADFKPLPADIRALFPAEFEETDLGWAPKTWKVESLNRIANFQNGLALQKFRPQNNEEEYLPVLKIADLRAGYINNEERATVDIIDSCKVYDGDMIFSWSGTLMIDIWTGGNAALNQHLYKVTSPEYPQSFYLMWTKQHLSRFQHIAEAKAVTMGHIKKGDLNDSLCLVPSSLLVDKYDSIVGKYYTKIKNQRLLNNQLTALRDTLLPKLISGELSLEDLPDIIKQTEAA